MNSRGIHQKMPFLDVGVSYLNFRGITCICLNVPVQRIMLIICKLENFIDTWALLLQGMVKCHLLACAVNLCRECKFARRAV